MLKLVSALDFQLSPVERYAVQFAELQLEPVNAEELMIAEVRSLFLSDQL